MSESLRKTLKYKLNPTPAQERELERVVMVCRWLYNTALEQRITLYRQRGISLTRYSQEAELKDVRAEMADYATIHSHVLQDVLARLDKTYQAFFRRVQRGEKAGFPRFQGRARWHSFTYKEYGNGARLDNGFLVLSKIGRVAVRWSRPIEGAPKTVTISREADGWYLCCSCADVPIQPLAPTGQETGIDLGLESFATLSDGTMIHNPRCYRCAERKLQTAQRKVSRRKKGSNRRRKAVKLLAKVHQTVKRQRTDFQHKTALQLVREHDTIYHEDLQTANMRKNRHLAKSISDAGWSAFLNILAAKAAYAGRRVVAVPPAYTSQTCSGCGVVVTKGLSVRWHSCPDCGASLHRSRRRQEHREGRAGPSGSRGVGRGGEPRIRGASAPAECQSSPRGTERTKAAAIPGPDNALSANG
ncbi:MAG TPA: transposase [Ktedonobacterales bacterium]|nr:transposase [Ktedonobacterales bacterium]